MTETRPAHPWRKTVRTVIAGIITAGLLLPLAIKEAGIDVTAEGWGWLGVVLVVLGAATRVLALPQVNVVLERLGIGHDDVEAGRVVAMKPDPDGTWVVAGDASPVPTGQTLPLAATVAEIAAPR